LLTLAFRRNGAALRFWLWFAASIKFLVPFAALAALGDYLSRQYPAPLPESILVLTPAAENFSAPAKMLVAPQTETINLAPLLLGLWLAGFAVILAFHLLRWSRLRGVMAQAHDLPGSTPIQIKTSASSMEPGLVGILQPAVLMPAGLMAHLSDAERDSILAHEISHLHRRDNVTAAIHTAVEALFWFYPPVWLIGSRLMAERERACDESVLASGHDPEIYAGGILKVCKFCIQSPLACAAGASGADLARRVGQIMTAEAAVGLSRPRQMLLAGAALLALVPPVVAGFPGAPLAVTVKRNVSAVQARAEQAVTAVAEQIGMAPVAPVTVRKLPRLKTRAVATLPSPTLAESTAAQPAEPPMPVASPPAAPVQAALSTAPLAQPAAKQVLALDPMGEGDPDAVTCRVPQRLPGSRLPGPQVCGTNRVWAALRAQREDISPDGTMIVYLDDFQRKKAMAGNCQATFFNRSGVIILPGPSTIFCF
jgi:beta-lactamase regulating signal transducer with metallopeptidase domain